MRRPAYPALYLRMALYIGAALTAFVIIGALAFAAIAAWELTGYLETRNSEIGRDAAVAADAGVAGLRDWLSSEAGIPEDTSIYVFDSSGRDILQRPIPDMYSDFVADALEAAAAPESSNFRPVRLTSQVVTPDGRVYSLLIVPRNVTLLGSVATAFGLLGVALVVIAIVAWLIAGRIGRPVWELQQAVRNLAAGDIHARVPDNIAQRRDELGQLASDFNSMAAHLNQLIEGRESLMRELSHELRSPLTRLQAALALASARNRLGEAERQRVDNEISQMNRVIGEILRYSALDASISMQIRLVRIDRLLRRLVEVEEIEARSSNCRLALHTANNLEVAGDPELLQRAFENVLRNAIRYTPAGSTIDIDAGRDAGDIVVSIRDRGPGVPAAMLEKIFEPYARAGSDNSGTGLGLAIVKRVVERHEGNVRAEVCTDGGLRVTARIPAADFS